ncbi:MAG: hypothetical protein R3264_23005, partial [Anaerolineae bacterium]|nr:hypothetical protein [Anaerolineae bacterium]
LGLSFLIFTITSPFVLLDFENFRESVLTEQGNMVSGVADFPFTRQYRNTPAYWYFIEQQLRWGMGWPLGLLALAGTIWVIGKALIGRAKPGELIALSWVVLYFGPTGIFLAKFMRYMVPVVPFFTLFGAGLIIALWKLGDRRTTALANQTPMWATSEAADRETSAGLQPNPSSSIFPRLEASDAPAYDIKLSPPDPPKGGEKSEVPPAGGLGGPPSPRPARSSPQPLFKRAVLALALLVVASTAIWSLAFVNGVYGTEHPWVTFARWTYDNVPDGSCIAWEHWDDRMPTDIPEPGGNPGFHNYHQPQLPMYDDDTRQKYELLRDTLMDCDYVVLATNRLSRTIPRLPERYPMSTRYYEALFSGALGFEPVYSVETPPRLASVVIDDQPADESFTVYDHPKPILFKKTRQLTESEWDAVLGNTWQGAIPGYVGDKTLSMWLRGAADPPQAAINSGPEPGKSLLLDTPVDQLTPVNDFRWNGLANRSTLVAVVIWWMLATLIGLLTFPLTFLLFDKLPDRGYA